MEVSDETRCSEGEPKWRGRFRGASCKQQAATPRVRELEVNDLAEFPAPMKGLFKRKATNALKPSGEARVTLAAFGKHPGWDDHLPGLGLETELLVQIKQVFYVRGIGGQIDSAAWERIDAARRQEG